VRGYSERSTVLCRLCFLWLTPGDSREGAKTRRNWFWKHREHSGHGGIQSGYAETRRRWQKAGGQKNDRTLLVRFVSSAFVPVNANCFEPRFCYSERSTVLCRLCFLWLTPGDSRQRREGIGFETQRTQWIRRNSEWLRGNAKTLAKKMVGKKMGGKRMSECGGGPLPGRSASEKWFSQRVSGQRAGLVCASCAFLWPILGRLTRRR